jgi:hypothetical protein
MPTCVLGVGMEIYCPLTWPGPAAVLPDTPQQPLCGLWSNVRSSPIGHNGVSQFKDAISAAGTSGTEGTLMRSEQRQEQQVLNALAMCVCGGGGGCTVAKCLRGRQSPGTQSLRTDLAALNFNQQPCVFLPEQRVCSLPARLPADRP